MSAQSIVLATQQGTFVQRWIVTACDGDWNLAAMVAQILYWHGADRSGQPRTKIERDGERWVAKAHEDWQSELGINASRAKRLAAKLRDTGLVRVEYWRFKGKRTAHYAPNYEAMLECIQGKCESAPTEPGGNEIAPTGGGEIAPTHNRDYGKDYKDKGIAADAAPAPNDGPSPSVQPHIALIDAMADELSLEAVDYGRHARDAVALLELGATPDKIRHTVRFALSDPKQREFFKTQPFSMTTCRKYFELAMAAGNSNGRSSGAVMDF